MTLRWVELALGWLAVLLAAAIAAFTYYGGFIAPGSEARDLLGFGCVVTLIALGVTVDSMLNWMAGKIVLALATLAFLGITAISFVSFLYLPAILTLLATVLAFARSAARRTP